MSKQALEGKRLNAFSMDPDTLVLIADENHPLYDPRVNLPLEESLVLNIMVYGVIEPVIVKKEGDQPVVVDGRQRTRCAREANRRLVKEGKLPLTVPVMIRRGSEQTLFGVMVSANENRQDDTILARADKAGRMLDMGASVDDVAISFGVTAQAVNIWLKLLDVSTNVRKAVEGGKISASAAAKLAPLSRDEQNTALKELLESGAATTAEATARVRTKQSGVESTPAPNKRGIKKLLKHLRNLDDCPFSDDFIQGVRWAIGDLPTSSIKGLTATMEEAKG